MPTGRGSRAVFEEWCSHMEEIKGNLAKTAHAIGCALSVVELSEETLRNGRAAKDNREGFVSSWLSRHAFRHALIFYALFLFWCW